jgi:hypothetical protein
MWLVAGVLTLAVFATAFAAASSGAATPKARVASCVGSSCLPSGPYSIDQTWNCGMIHSTDRCWDNGLLNTTSGGEYHTWGFASASYAGTGVGVNVEAYDPNAGLDRFGGTGTDLVRTCYSSTCVDQATYYMFAGVGNDSYHTISGHAEG